jgi:hypothetical protein
MSREILNRRAVCLAIAWMFVPLAWLCAATLEARAGELVLEPKMRHLRNAEPREWTEFSEQAEAKELAYSFEVTDTFRPQTLVLRHRDLRRDWLLTLDGQTLIRLAQGDQDATTFWPLDAARFKPGKHELKISCKDKLADDVMIGELRLDTRTKAEMLGEATVDVEVTEQERVSPNVEEKLLGGGPVPCRLTLVDERGSLMTVGIEPESRLAIRPGVIYTLDGKAKLTVPAGKYVLYASRGFEYSVAETKLELKAGTVAKPRLKLVKEVDVVSFAAVDTHVHTLTHSGHGDCTLEERVVTLAGEGLEGAISTEHNKAIDYYPTIVQLSATNFVAAMTGNEVTTSVGHFNVYPLNSVGPTIDHRGANWEDVGKAIVKGDTKPPTKHVILNHARDIHNGFRPFGPERHISIAGEDAEGWKLPATAMEVFNSGSTQNDPTQLFHDWLGLLNRGLKIAPIGSSDSHDVSRYIVGQGRSYYGFDSGPAMGEPLAASMGLLCTLVTNQTIRGLAPHADEYDIRMNVYAPSWIKADEVRLFVNGSETTEKPATDMASSAGPFKRTLRWKLRFKHDVHVVALGRGPGIDKPYWPIAKPYQPTSPDWKSYVIGCSAAIRIDGDGDGKYSSPYDYAKKLFAEHGADDAKLVAGLKDYDEAVAVQAASVARAAGRERFDAFLAAVAKDGAEQTKVGARKYVEGWRATLVGAAGETSSPEKK